MSKKRSKLKIAQERAQNAINDTNEKIEKLGEVTTSLYSELCSIQESFDAIRNVPTDKKIQV